MATLPTLNLRQLQHVVLLAEEGHFGRAATRAFLSQPAFSRSVATLEAQLGIRLFERGPGFVRLTSTGEQVMARARRLLTSSADLARELDQLRSGDLGNITIGSGPFSGPTLMARAIAQLQAQHPSVHVRLEIATPLALQQMLLEEKLDFFLSDQTGLIEHTRCTVEPLGDAIGGLYVRPTHPLAAQSQVTLADIQRHPLASVHLPTPLSRKLAKIFGSDETGLVALTMECESALVLREYALNHEAVVLAPQTVFAQEEQAGWLRQLNVVELNRLGNRTPLRMALGLTWLNDRTPSAAALLLAEALRQVARAALI